MGSLRRLSIIEDNGTKQEFEVFLPNIRDIKGFLEGEWNLRVYEKCFPDSNRLGDIDGSVELEGHLLVVEFKRVRSALTKGQLMKAIRMARFSHTTTFFVFGETDRPTEYLRISPKCLNSTGFVSCTEADLKKEFSKWSKYAKRNSLIKNVEDRNDWGTVKRIMNAVSERSVKW